VAKRNARGGVTTAENAVPVRPRMRPPAKAARIASPVNIPTFVKEYSKVSKMRISRN
jgi:hypothetical protein